MQVSADSGWITALMVVEKGSPIQEALRRSKELALGTAQFEKRDEREREVEGLADSDHSAASTTTLGEFSACSHPW